MVGDGWQLKERLGGIENQGTERNSEMSPGKRRKGSEGRQRQSRVEECGGLEKRVGGSRQETTGGMRERQEKAARRGRVPPAANIHSCEFGEELLEPEGSSDISETLFCRDLTFHLNKKFT